MDRTDRGGYWRESGGNAAVIISNHVQVDIPYVWYLQVYYQLISALSHENGRVKRRAVIRHLSRIRVRQGTSFFPSSSPSSTASKRNLQQLPISLHVPVMPFDGKAMFKGGWHPAGDRAIKKETWKSDIKGLATGKKKDPFAEQREHQSAPLTSLRDPDTFGPPPKARSHYGEDGRPINPVAVPSRSSAGGAGVSSANIPHSLASIPTDHKGGLGAPVVETGYAQRRQREAEERERREQEELNRERGPYQKDTTGINTAHFAAPPRHFAVGGGSSSGAASPSPSLPPSLPPRVPPRQLALSPPPPSRQTTGTISAQNSGPAPFLPPRQNEYPDEHTPAPPPTYGEALNSPPLPAQNTSNRFEAAATGAAQRFGAQAATSWMNQKQQQGQHGQDPAAINQGAAGRLAGAGISVPGFGIGSSSSQQQTQQQHQIPMPSSQQVRSAASFASGAASRFGQQNQTSSTAGQAPGGQLSELQQRFARMGASGSSNAGPAGQESGVISPGPSVAATAAAATAAQKKPPPPPPKKASLQAALGGENGSTPPPVPMSSKPKW